VKYLAERADTGGFYQIEILIQLIDVIYHRAAGQVAGDGALWRMCSNRFEAGLTRRARLNLRSFFCADGTPSALVSWRAVAPAARPQNTSNVGEGGGTGVNLQPDESRIRIFA